MKCYHLNWDILFYNSFHKDSNTRRLCIVKLYYYPQLTRNNALLYYVSIWYWKQTLLLEWYSPSVVFDLHSFLFLLCISLIFKAKNIANSFVLYSTPSFFCSFLQMKINCFSYDESKFLKFPPSFVLRWISCSIPPFNFL